MHRFVGTTWQRDRKQYAPICWNNLTKRQKATCTDLLEQLDKETESNMHRFVGTTWQRDRKQHVPICWNNLTKRQKATCTDLLEQLDKETESNMHRFVKKNLFTCWLWNYALHTWLMVQITLCIYGLWFNSASMEKLTSINDCIHLFFNTNVCNLWRFYHVHVECNELRTWIFSNRNEIMRFCIYTYIYFQRTTYLFFNTLMKLKETLFIYCNKKRNMSLTRAKKLTPWVLLELAPWSQYEWVANIFPQMVSGLLFDYVFTAEQSVNVLALRLVLADLSATSWEERLVNSGCVGTTWSCSDGEFAGYRLPWISYLMLIGFNIATCPCSRARLARCLQYITYDYDIAPHINITRLWHLTQ